MLPDHADMRHAVRLPERGREEIRAAHDGDLDDVAGKVELEIKLEGLFNERGAVECIGTSLKASPVMPLARPAAAALRASLQAGLATPALSPMERNSGRVELMTLFGCAGSSDVVACTIITGCSETTIPT